MVTENFERRWYIVSWPASVGVKRDRLPEIECILTSQCSFIIESFPVSGNDQLSWKLCWVEHVLQRTEERSPGRLCVQYLSEMQKISLWWPRWQHILWVYLVFVFSVVMVTTWTAGLMSPFLSVDFSPHQQPIGGMRFLKLQIWWSLWNVLHPVTMMALMRDISVKVCILEGVSCLSLSQPVNAVFFFTVHVCCGSPLQCSCWGWRQYFSIWHLAHPLLFFNKQCILGSTGVFRKARCLWGRYLSSTVSITSEDSCR